MSTVLSSLVYLAFQGHSIRDKKKTNFFPAVSGTSETVGKITHFYLNLFESFVRSKYEPTVFVLTTTRLYVRIPLK